MPGSLFEFSDISMEGTQRPESRSFVREATPLDQLVDSLSRATVVRSHSLDRARDRRIRKRQWVRRQSTLDGVESSRVKPEGETHDESLDANTIVGQDYAFAFSVQLTQTH